MIEEKTSFRVGERIGHNKPAQPHRPCFLYREEGHTPVNKRHGEVNSVALLSVEDFKGSPEHKAEPWTCIELEELTTGDNGRTQGRTISVVLKGEARATLKRMLAADEWRD